MSKLHNLLVVNRSFLKKTTSINKSFRTMFVWVIKILQCERINVSEGIDINKSNQSKESKICDHWYVKEIGYKF